MCVMESNVRTINYQLWCAVVMLLVVVEVACLSGPNVCVVKQKYNITKRVKYRAPMSVRTYEWCFSMPPRCSRWDTEMRDLTRLETEERTAEVSVCCPGYKMQDISCVPICPNGKTGASCSQGCPPNKWGPNCVHECRSCSNNGSCSPITGACVCQDGWQGESCQTSMSTTTSTTTMKEILTTLNTTQVSTTTTTVIPTPSSTTIPSTKTTVPSTTSVATKTTTETTTPLPSTVKNISTTKTPVVTTKLSTIYNSPISIFTTVMPATEIVTNKIIEINNIAYNRTEPTANSHKGIFTEATTLGNRMTTIFSNTTLSTSSSPSTFAPTTTRATKGIPITETTKKPETTVKVNHTTMKFKPKEIWIKPAQKGESPILEIKTLHSHESHTKNKPAAKKELAPETTTPKTIIVSIIPTSVSYATFRKIALSTASYVAQKNVTAVRAYSQPIEVTSSMSISTSTSTSAKLNTLPLKQTTVNPSFSVNVTKAQYSTTAPTRGHPSTKSIFVNNKTNSMISTTVVRMSTSNSLTMTSSTNSPTTKHGTSFKKYVASYTTSTIKPVSNVTEQSTLKYFTTKHNIEAKQKNVTLSNRDKTLPKVKNEVIEKSNVTKQNSSSAVNTKSKTNTVTARPGEGEETFHILTEPEHITAVMGEKGTDRSSVDLISVISIAGGIMMAVITVAVVIVMIERCKRPRYEDVRKINDVRMQVMIDSNDVPPPYVRSIFHTPLPEPPNSEKCHYQPISTLDRNLKQFMRPVVVQTISPMMLENFRGILECHYDHLPQRSQEFGTLPARFATTPSMSNGGELSGPRALSVTESTIEALKCEAKLDVIDNTTSEPLYAEIPCWRPPSEHAIEIININGEAVTEL
ncbi:mucin-2-like [Plodia interpunctella]|uniref:mucin-2-like n=1 Tax=Plodia interpunctella TaxID=58824 RepID=UPI002367A9B6|nr:mucin-5AC-like [Plodia interpunctella]XP_053603737.1 mucin-5AC-like [Plodia interpunctella]XP_053603738.1 mucin-5AC-like [Plodia interpunctella]